MRQLNNKQFDTKEGASASHSELSHPQLAPSVSQKDEIMILTLKNNQTKKEKNWNDTALNIMTRKNNIVTVESIYRYAPSQKRTMTYSEFKDWRLDILKEGGK